MSSRKTKYYFLRQEPGPALRLAADNRHLGFEKWNFDTLDFEKEPGPTSTIHRIGNCWRQGRTLMVAALKFLDLTGEPK